MKRHIIVNSETLKRIRKELGIKQEDMANSLGVTRKTYIRYEAERAYLSDDTICKLASLLNVDADKLILLDINKEIEKIKCYPDDKLKERLNIY